MNSRMAIALTGSPIRRSASNTRVSGGTDMWAYIVRRILLTVPIVIGIVIITMFLFTVLVKDPARLYAGRHATPQVLESIRARMGIDKPRWFDAKALVRGEVGKAFDTQFFD